MTPVPEERRRIGPLALRASAAGALVVVVIGTLVWQGRPLMVVLAGALFALALRGPSAWLAEQSRLPYKAVLGAVVAIVLVSIGCGVYFLGSGIARQAGSF